MFVDIIKETQSLHFPELISESVGELRFKQSQSFIESSQYNTLAFILNKNNIFLESDGDQNKQSLIRRFIEYFKRLIAKLKDYLDRKFKITEGRLNRLQKYLLTINHSSLSVDTYSNINSFGSILDTLYKGMEELKGYRVNQLQDTFSKMGKIQQGTKVVKAFTSKFESVFDEFKGYVPTLSKYNNMERDEIKRSILGEKKSIAGVKVDEFFPTFKKAQEFKFILDQLSSEYSKTLNSLNFAANFTNKTNMLSPNVQNFFSNAVHAVTSFFNRNMNLILGLVVEIMNSVVSTASSMVIKAKGSGMKKKLNEETN